MQPMIGTTFRYLYDPIIRQYVKECLCHSHHHGNHYHGSSLIIFKTNLVTY